MRVSGQNEMPHVRIWLLLEKLKFLGLVLEVFEFSHREEDVEDS